MGTFRDIWNLVVTGDTSDVDRKLGALGKTAESTGATADTSIRGRMGSALGDVAQKIPGVSGLMDKFGVSSSQAGALMGTAVAAGAASAGLAVEKFVVTSVQEFQNQAQEVLHFKEVTGLAADEASRFVAVADDFGVSGDDLSAAMGKLDKAAGTTPQKLEALGIQLGKNKDGAYDAQQTFLNVVQAFNATDDASKKAEIGATAFGRGWQSVVKLLDVGADKLKTSFAGVKDFQLFNEKDLKKSEDYRHAMDDLGDAVHGLERQVGEALVPAISKAAGEFTHMIEEINKAGGPIGDVIGKFGSLGDYLHALTNPGQLAIDKFHDLTNAVGDFFGSGDDNGNLVKSIDAFYHKQDEATRAQDDAAAASHEAALAVAAHKRELDKMVEAGIMYGQTNAGITQALNDQREAAAKATDQLARYREEVQHLANEQLGLQGATYNTMDAIDAYTAKAKDGNSTLRDLAESSISVQQSFRGLAEKAVQAAAAQAEMNGSTLTASGAIDAQVAALQVLFKNLASDSPLRKALDEYILSLYKIPGVITTNVDLTGTDWNIVKGREGNTSIGGQTSGAVGYSTPAAVVGAIKTYESSNGTSWRTGPQ